MKKCLLLIFGVCLAFIACNKGGKGEASGEPKAATAAPAAAPIILRIANDMAITHPKSQGIEAFAAYINEHSNGRIKAEAYHDGVLGGPNEYLEAVIAGTIQAATIGTEFEPRAPITVSWEVPFLFPSWDHVKKVAYSDFAAHLYDNFPKDHNVRAVGWIPQGRRLMMMNRPVRSMADFHGLRLRVPQIDLYLNVGRNLGASPIAVPLVELYSALEQRIVDGFELPHGNMVTGRYYEVLDYLLLTEHITAFHNMYMNEPFFQSLGPDLQKVVLDAGRYMTDQTFKFVMDFEKDALDFLAKQGMTIITPSEAFRKDLVASQMETRKLLFAKYPIVEETVKQFQKIMDN